MGLLGLANFLDQRLVPHEGVVSFDQVSFIACRQLKESKNILSHFNGV